MNRSKMLRTLAASCGSFNTPEIYIDGPAGNFARNKNNLVRYKLAFNNQNLVAEDFNGLLAAIKTVPDVEKVYLRRSTQVYGRYQYWSVILWFRGRASKAKKVATVRPPKAWEGVEPITKPTTNLGTLLRDKFERDEMAKAEAVKVRDKFERLLGMVDELSLNYDDLNMLVLLIGMQGDADFIADTLDPVNEMDWQLDKDGCTYADPIRAAAMMDDIVNETEMNRMAKKLRDAGVDLNKLFRVHVEQKVTVERVR